VLAADATGVWAWTGVQITAAADLTEVREYADLPEAERLAKAAAEQVAFLSGHLGQPVGTPLELRWLWQPERQLLRAFLLTRVRAADEAGARLAAQAAAVRLGGAPRHVFTEVLDEAELREALGLFPIDAAGAIEVRKRVLVETPQRPDAGVAYYFGVQPFPASTRSWEPVLAAMTAHAQPVALSIGVCPVAVPYDFSRAVGAVATQYARLATEGDWNHGMLHSGRVKLTADAFAVEAQKLYADAARRYQGTALRLRIALASPAPLGEELAAVVGTTVSRSERGESESYLSSDSLGAAYVLERPTAGDLATFAHNLGSLSFGDWGGHPVWASAGPPPAALRPLTWIADVEEASSAFRLPIAVHGTLPGVPVRARPPAVVADYVAGGPHVLLGGQQAGAGDRPLGIELGDITRHALFLGTTGSGKTNSTLSFVRQLWADHRVPFLVLDPVNSDRSDYRWLATLPEFEDLLILTVGAEDVAPLRLNPFEVPVGVRVSTHMANLRSCFDAAFGLWDPLPAIYARALRTTYLRAGFDVNAQAAADDAWPVLGDFIDAIKDATENLDYAGEVRSNILAASQLRAESLAEGPCGPVLSAARSFPIEDLLSRPVVLELGEIGDDTKEQALVMALLLNAMTEHYKTHRQSSDLAHVTVIEEAHRLLGRPSPGGDAKQGDAQARAAEAFANTLAENRKYGEGLVIVEQSPSKLIPDAYKNTNLKVMHQLLSQEDRELIGDTMRFSDDQQSYAGALPKMAAFAFHSRLDRPALVVVDDVRARDAEVRGMSLAPLATRAEVAERHARWVASHPVAAEALAPQAPCGVCALHCVLDFSAGQAAVGGEAAFRDLLKRWPRQVAGRDEWWRDLREAVDRVGESARPRRIKPGDAHWRTALFVALYRAAWPTGDLSRWLPLVRQQAATASDAEPQPDAPLVDGEMVL
jgi:hypothetical protein